MLTDLNLLVNMHITLIVQIILKQKVLMEYNDYTDLTITTV
jgi:hypothetical protein